MIQKIKHLELLIDPYKIAIASVPDANHETHCNSKQVEPHEEILVFATKGILLEMRVILKEKRKQYFAHKALSDSLNGKYNSNKVERIGVIALHTDFSYNVIVTSHPSQKSDQHGIKQYPRKEFAPNHEHRTV